MKTVLTSIITSLITVIIALFVVHAIWGDGGCAISGEKHEKECTEKVKQCCDKKAGNTHEMMMEKLEPIRIKFDAELSEEEKATIAAIREKFEDIEHDEMCPEGKAKFMEEHKADFTSLIAIADNHKEFFDGLFAKVHAKGEVHKDGKCPEAEKCKEATEKCKGEKKVAEGEVVKEAGCPEAAKCKEASEACKGEKKAPHDAEKCKEAEEKCKVECANTFKIHFLLMEEHSDEDDKDEGEHEEGDDD